MFRSDLGQLGATAVIPGLNSTSSIRHDKARIRACWHVDAAIGRLKDFRRVATRSDKLARTVLVAITDFWV